jgi:hypothetical protein
MSALPKSLARFQGELEDAIGRELKAPPRSNSFGNRALGGVRRRPGRTMVALAGLAAAAAAALFVSSPWKTAPGFLDQVQAAITPPDGSVLHVKVVITDNIDAGCKVTWPTVEYWIDQTPPYNHRGFEATKGKDICAPGRSVEIGGDLTSKQVLVFRPPNTLAPLPDYPIDSEAGPDPVANLRRAIDDGTAHHEGTRVLDGRTVERIRVGCDAASPGCEPMYTYVDPETFHPVRTDYGDGLRFSSDFETYDYLPGTPANRALADIRAQHPDATGP